MFLTPGSRANRKRVGATVISPPLSLNFGTITTNPGEPTPGMALSIVGTWNNAATTFDAPLFMNITNTAGHSGSLIVDWQVSGNPIFQIDASGPANGINYGILITTNSNAPRITTTTGSVSFELYPSGSGLGFRFSSGAAIFISDGTTNRMYLDLDGGNGTIVAFKNTNGNNNGFRIYNTVDTTFGAPTNYERGAFDFTTTTNVLTFGTQAGGSGTVRSINFVTGALTGFNLPAGGWLQWPGQARNTSNFTSSNTTLTNITGLSSVVLQAGRNYKFEAWLSTTGSSNGGILVGITCTSTTITTLATDGFLLDGSTIRGGQGVISSTGTAVISVSSATVTNATASVRLSGLIRVASSGLFGLTLAQSTANNAPQTIVSSGSWLEVFDVA